MDNVYRGLREVGSGKQKSTEEFDLGIRGLRSLAVDFSGRAGRGHLRRGGSYHRREAEDLDAAIAGRGDDLGQRPELYAC